MLDAACGVGILSTAPRATRAPSFPIPPVAAFPDLRCQSCPTLSLSRSEVQALHGPSPLLFFLPRMTPPPPPSQPGSEWIPLGPSFLPPSLALASQSSRILRDRPRSHRRLLPSPPSRSPRAVSPTSPATSDWSRIRARIQNQMAFELRQLPSRFSGNCMPSRRWPDATASRSGGRGRRSGKADCDRIGRSMPCFTCR